MEALWCDMPHRKGQEGRSWGPRVRGIQDRTPPLLQHPCTRRRFREECAPETSPAALLSGQTGPSSQSCSRPPGRAERPRGLDDTGPAPGPPPSLEAQMASGRTTRPTHLPVQPWDTQHRPPCGMAFARGRSGARLSSGAVMKASPALSLSREGTAVLWKGAHP